MFHPKNPREALPTMYDLPAEQVGDPGMPDIFHVWQTRLLDETFHPPNYAPEEVFSACDLNLYYNVHDFTQYKRPDWFAVVGLPKLPTKPDMRLSYVIWQEGVVPLLVVELLSPGTQKEGLGETLCEAGSAPPKWEVYERWLRVPYYVTFSRYTDELRIFELVKTRYREVKDHQGRFWLEEVALGLGLWQGSYLNEERLWLRWYDRAGLWLPTQEEEVARRNQQIAQRDQQIAQQEELLEQERQRLAQERNEKEAAQQKAQQLAAKLRELGIDPDQV